MHGYLAIRPSHVFFNVFLFFILVTFLCLLTFLVLFKRFYIYDMARWFILTLSRLSSYVMIIGQSLRSSEEDVTKEVGATSSDDFLFSLICRYGPRGNTLTVRRF